jgi:hypothetical protein
MAARDQGTHAAHISRREAARRPPMRDDPVERLRSEWSLQCRVSDERMRAALADDGCPLCALSGRVTKHMLIAMLRADRYPAATARQIHRAQGWCPAHAWLLLDAATAEDLPAHGVFDALIALLDDAHRSLAAYGGHGLEDRLDPSIFKRTLHDDRIKGVRRRITPRGRCMICLLIKRIHEELGYQMLTLLGAAEVRTGYGWRAALCLPHFRWALEHTADTAVLDCLVEAEARRLASLLTQASVSELRACLAHAVGSRAMSPDP